MVEDRGQYLPVTSRDEMVVDILKLNDDEDIYYWKLALIVLNPDSMYYGGYFKAIMTFPKDYPYAPPGMVDLCVMTDHI